MSTDPNFNSEERPPFRLSVETWILGLICVADMVSTVLLFRAGKAVEANPLLIPALNRGAGWFIVVKSAFFLVPLLGLEYLRTHRPRFVKTMLRAGIAGYLAIYVVGGLRLNAATTQLKQQIAAQSNSPHKNESKSSE